MLGVLFFVAWHGSIWFDTLAIASAVHNFGADRGKVMHRYSTRQCGMRYNALGNMRHATDNVNMRRILHNATRMLVGMPACLHAPCFARCAVAAQVSGILKSMTGLSAVRNPPIPSVCLFALVRVLGRVARVHAREGFTAQHAARSVRSRPCVGSRFDVARARPRPSRFTDIAADSCANVPCCRCNLHAVRCNAARCIV